MSTFWMSKESKDKYPAAAATDAGVTGVAALAAVVVAVMVVSGYRVLDHPNPQPNSSAIFLVLRCPLLLHTSCIGRLNFRIPQGGIGSNVVDSMARGYACVPTFATQEDIHLPYCIS